MPFLRWVGPFECMIIGGLCLFLLLPLGLGLVIRIVRGVKVGDR